jgi:hypothetical protein
MCTPFGAYLMAWHAPHLLGIRFVKHHVQLFAEPVDQEILQRTLLTLRQERRTQIAEPTTKSTGQAHLLQRVGGQENRIVKEAAHEINAAFARAHQHNEIFSSRVRGRSRRQKFALPALVAKGADLSGAGLKGQYIQPPAHHPIRLRKESVTANVHSVALVTHGPRKAADSATRLNQNWLDSRAPLQFDCRCKAGWTCADNDSRPVFHERIRFFENRLAQALTRSSIIGAQGQSAAEK